MSRFEQYFTDINEYKSKRLGLSRIDEALSSINFDHRTLGRVIHIAGTNGKGSTAGFLSQIFVREKYNTALFTSPHIIKINERLKLNNEAISDYEFDRYFDDNFDLIKKFDLTYFEAIFFLAVKYFANLTPDITVLETGLGGRFDATNTSLINEKISVITKISSDHTDVFGKNIFKIADEKLGIIRDENKVFIGVNLTSIEKYLIQNSASKEVSTTDISEFAKLNYPHPYTENYSLSKNIAEYILQKNINDINDLSLPPARLDRYKNIVFDGSHNVSGMLALKKNFYASPPEYIILSSTKERDIKKSIEILSRLNSVIFVTSIPNEKRSIEAAEIEKIDGVRFIENPIEAVKLAQKSNPKTILITGSFYLAAYCKKNLSELIV